MQIVRTIIWVLLFVGLLAFTFANWTRIDVTIWPDMVVNTPLPTIVIISFLIGLIPMWLFHRGARWSLNRKIANLETSAKNAAAAAAPPPAPAPSPVLRPNEPKNPVDPVKGS